MCRAMQGCIAAYLSRGLEFAKIRGIFFGGSPSEG